MKEYIDPSIFNKKLLPDNVTISTMSCTCKMGTKIILENIDKYMKLEDHDVITVKYLNNIRSLDPKKLKKKKESSKNFFNQLTLEVRPCEEKKINIKLFKNGSVQMTGCKSIEDINSALERLIKKISIVKAKIEENKIIEKKFVEDAKGISITDFKIDMINSNFQLSYMVNREALYKILVEKQIECRYEPCIHACVNIKYKPDEDKEKKVSIFVFQSGNIIITGAKNHVHILRAYKYINTILAEHKTEIQKKDIGNLLEDSEFSDLLC